MSTDNTCDVLIKGGTIYDGTGVAPVTTDLAIKDGKVLDTGDNLGLTAATTVDAEGKWVTPGFLDLHTHYDAEVEVMPGLEESVQHGVTTVVMGNCSLSAVYGTDEELIDLFCRVESLPRDIMEKWLIGNKSWNAPSDYYEHLDTLNLGPNVGSLIGHSNVRVDTMGLERSLTVQIPEKKEIEGMQARVKECLETGFIGLSIDMLPWHRMDGDRFRGVSVPSQQARPKEYRALANVVREYGRVLQATPNALNKKTVLEILGLSVGLGRKPLKTTVVAAMDVKTNRTIYRLASAMASVVNGALGGDVKWQTLAEPFLNYCDGVITPLFEEIPSGVEAISADPEKQRALFKDPVFREAFRKDWVARGERVFHRDLDDMWIIKLAGDETYAGKSFQQVADKRGEDALELFMDLLGEYGNELRWHTTVSNDRDDPRAWLLTNKHMIPGFNDSGAHNRNMAFYDGGLQMIKQTAVDRNLMPVEKAIHKLTKQTADWIGIDAGSIRPGDRADVNVIDPECLKKPLSTPVEHYDSRLDGAMRMVKRQGNHVINNVFIGGKEAYCNGEFSSKLGNEKFGQLLRARN